MSARIDKINELIKEAVSGMILEELGGQKGFITVLSVDTTRDMRQTTVWYSLIGMEDSYASELLEGKRKIFQAGLNKRMSSKHVPRISFRIDKSGDYADEISKLLRDVKNEDESRKKHS